MGRATKTKQRSGRDSNGSDWFRKAAEVVAAATGGGCRAGRWLLQWHPCLAGTVAAVAVVLLVTGPWGLAVSAAVATLGLGGWWNCHPESFQSQVVDRARSGWRREWVFRRQWRETMFLAHLAVVMEGREIVPRLGRVRSTRGSDIVEIRLCKAQTARAFETMAGELAESFKALECHVMAPQPGRVVCEFIRRREIPVVPPLPIPARPNLDGLPIGRHRDGKLWRLRLTGAVQWLIAGATGAGKSSVLWSIVRALAVAIRDGWVEVWACDPKRMELAAGRPMFARYARTELGCVELLEAAVEVMTARADRLGGVTRQHTPSPEAPTVVILIDEIAPILKWAPQDLIARADAALGKLLSQGRAAGIHVIACVQEPLKATLKLRGLFPARIALRLSEADEVDPMLGRGAHARGARCEQIPVDAAGCAWVRDDDAWDLAWVRASWNTSTDIAQIAKTHAAPHHIDHDQLAATATATATAVDGGMAGGAEAA